MEESVCLSWGNVDYKVGVEGCSWDTVVACRHGSGDRVTGFFTVEVLDEGPYEFLEAAGLQWVRRPAWNRFLAFSNSLEVEMCGFSFLMDSIAMLVIELDSSRAMLTRSSGLILWNR
jgi:hypothetical protein